MNQKDLDNNIERIHFLTDQVKLLEKKTKLSPDDIALKIQLVETILEYEELSSATIKLLDEAIAREDSTTNVFNFQYRRLRKRLAA